MLRTFVYGYVFLIVFWWLAWQIAPDANWFLYCANRIAPYLYVPGLIVPLITLVLSRRLSLTLLSLSPLVIFLTIFWPYLAPRGGTEDGSDLSVMSYNILCSNSNVTGIANVIRRDLPDLIAFQEMTQSQFADLSELLKDSYPYREISHQVPCGTTAVFSQLPITEHRVIDLNTDRPAMLTVVELNNNPVVFVSAHLLPMYYARIQPLAKRPAAINEFIAAKARQVQTLIDALSDFEADPVIIGCDCNTLLTHATYKTLNAQFTDAATKAGHAGSKDGARRNNNPYQLDYVFARGPLEPLTNFRLSDSAGSDHLPVLTHFATTN